MNQIFFNIVSTLSGRTTGGVWSSILGYPIFNYESINETVKEKVNSGQDLMAVLKATSDFDREVLGEPDSIEITVFTDDCNVLKVDPEVLPPPSEVHYLPELDDPLETPEGHSSRMTRTRRMRVKGGTPYEKPKRNVKPRKLINL